MKIIAITTGTITVGLHLSKAYIYCTNAQCSDSTTISGTFNMAYDDILFEGFGLQFEYYVGKCLYFANGYMDILNDEVYSSFVERYCAGLELKGALQHSLVMTSRRTYLKSYHCTKCPWELLLRLRALRLKCLSLQVRNYKLWRAPTRQLSRGSNMD